jgi:hypothetical protein
VALPLANMAATEAALPDFYETLGNFTRNYTKNDITGDEVCRKNLIEFSSILARRKARTSVDTHTMDAVLSLTLLKSWKCKLGKAS